VYVSQKRTSRNEGTVSISKSIDRGLTFPDSKRFEHDSRSVEFDRGSFPFQAGREGGVRMYLFNTAHFVGVGFGAVERRRGGYS
jgi:hypothetical protein